MAEEIKGNSELRAALPHGVMKEITEAFEFKSQSHVADMIGGTKRLSNPLVLECAERIVQAYEDCGFEEQKEIILKDYEVING